MITDLFAAVSGIDPDSVIGAVPPACRRAMSPPVPLTLVGPREGLLEFPAWVPRTSVRHLLPSLSILGAGSYAARFEVAVASGGTWSPWVATATIGAGALDPLPSRTEALDCDIDVYTARMPVDAVRLRVRVAGPDVGTLAAAPWMVTLSACDLTVSTFSPPPMPAARLAVPSLSQCQAPAEIASRVCSPVSVSMVLGYLGAATDVPSLAAEMFHPATDRYGVWPAAIQAAGRRGAAGYLLRFPDWISAAWCLGRGLPIVASINYAAGELTGAAMPATPGHLVVLTGHDRSHVLVNDPAAPTAAEVPRRYLRDEFRRVWLDRTGVGYVFFRP